MGSERESGRQRRGWRIAGATIAVLTLFGCTSDAAPERTTVTPANAYTAIVRWEIERSEPVLDEDGNIEAPVIYVAAGSGGTVDVAVQASVISDIDEDAVIRFADSTDEARDQELEDAPVKDDGVMLVIDDFEEGQTSVDARIVRYRSVDDDIAWILELIATAEGSDVVASTEAEDQPA